MGSWSLPPRFHTRKLGRTHGLRSTYTHGCHCDDCREAERVYRANLRGSTRENRRPYRRRLAS